MVEKPVRESESPSLRGPSARIRKTVFAALLIVLVVCSASSLVHKLFQTGFMKSYEEKTNRYLNQTLIQCVTAYAVARSLNAGISVVQSVTVSFSGGIAVAEGGIELAPGEVLDAFNDIIERFSWIMLVSTTSLGIQKIVMEVGPWIGFDVSVPIALLFVLIGYLSSSDKVKEKTYSIGLNLFIFSMILVFSVPFIVFANDQIYRRFLESKYTDSVRELNEIDMQIRSFHKSIQITGQDESAILDRIQKTLSNVNPLEWKNKIETLWENTKIAIDYIFILIQIFIFQTIIIPLASIWCLTKALRLLA